MLRSEATASIICLPRMPLTAPELQNTDTNEIRATWPGNYYILLLRAHILNINMHKYITSAQGHEKDA